MQNTGSNQTPSFVERMGNTELWQDGDLEAGIKGGTLQPGYGLFHLTQMNILFKMEI
jgi:hypothetical protein